MTLGGEALSAYEIFASVGILAYWVASGVAQCSSPPGNGRVFHLAAELLAAAFLLTSGLLEFIGAPSELLSAASLGMLLYASVNAVGLVGQGRRLARWGLLVEAAITSVLVAALCSGLLSLP